MTQVHAAFTYSGRISSQRIRTTSHQVAQWADLTLGSIHSGVAGGWVILCAQLHHAPTERAHAWLLQTLHELEQEHAQVKLFRVEISSEPS
ncbi:MULTISPECIES: hypothetical protein [Deinococcus]|uniref:Uncharacterized protein n=1 Tax=Deinococcus cavernae TaxID=2320857 RepID=A0A418V9G2_9DEIO|nr:MULTISPECIES: hypothetical protein [Deinococcus]RJF72720.1 hypothetical protein D3875_15410 [Deinococcus cavernae]